MFFKVLAVKSGVCPTCQFNARVPKHQEVPLFVSVIEQNVPMDIEQAETHELCQDHTWELASDLFDEEFEGASNDRTAA